MLASEPMSKLRVRIRVKVRVMVSTCAIFYRLSLSGLTPLLVS